MNTNENNTPFLATFIPPWDIDKNALAIEEAIASHGHYDPISQTSNIPLSAGTSQTFTTTKSGGPIVFSGDDSKPTDG